MITELTKFRRRGTGRESNRTRLSKRSCVPVVVLFDEHSVAGEGVLHARAWHARAQVREHEDLQQRVHALHRCKHHRFRLRVGKEYSSEWLASRDTKGSKINAFHTISFTNMARKSAACDKI